jgi:hypothetical protein
MTDHCLAEYSAALPEISRKFSGSSAAPARAVWDGSGSYRVSEDDHGGSSVGRQPVSADLSGSIPWGGAATCDELEFRECGGARAAPLCPLIDGARGLGGVATVQLEPVAIVPCAGLGQPGGGIPAQRQWTFMSEVSVWS